MSLTFAKGSEGVIGNLRYWQGTITLDNSYATGGYAITAANFLFGSSIFFLHLGQGDVGVMVEWLPLTSKIKCWFPTGGATAPTSLTAPVSAAGTITFAGTATGTMATGAVAVLSSTSTPTVTVPGAGLTASFAGGSGLTGGVAIEVGNTTNLSTVIVQAFAVGQ